MVKRVQIRKSIVRIKTNAPRSTSYGFTLALHREPQPDTKQAGSAPSEKTWKHDCAHFDRL